MLAIVAPGQGAQNPGMLASWLRDPQIRHTLTGWSATAGVDLVRLGTTATATDIARTEHTQPLLVAAGMLALDLVGTGCRSDVDGSAEATLVAGHSVGELTAAAYAETLTPTDAVWLAAARGRAMARACASAATSMSAVVGGDPDAVLDRLVEFDLVPANYNGPGQIVAAGLVRDLERLAAHPPAGSAVRPLAVAGAFHTHHMAAAQEDFGAAVDAVEFREPRHPIVSNADGTLLTSASDIRARLVAQLTRPVRWDRCLDTLRACAPDLVVAAPPGRTLAGILKRHLASEVAALTTPRDLDVVRRRLVGRDGGLISVGA